jgi:hypothetical protein
MRGVRATRTAGDGGCAEDAERPAHEVGAVLCPPDAHRLAERARSAAEAPRRRVGEPAPPAHERLAVERLERAQEDRLGDVARLADDVHAVMHPVDEVHVRVDRAART